MCSKLIHQECVDKLAAKSEDNCQINLENTHIEIKLYRNSSLLYPLKPHWNFQKKLCVGNGFICNKNTKICTYIWKYNL